MKTLIASDRSTPKAPLLADCARCRGLCCILLPFDADQGFAFDKAAGTPCSHLTAQFSCGIYRELAHSGFPGCKHYDCHGAGQYVTALLDLGADWYESETLLAEAYGLFVTAKALHGRVKERTRRQGREIRQSGC